MTTPLGRAVEQGRRAAAELGEIAGAIWLRSLAIRVVTSTLALSTAVVLVLGLVLQTQIADRLVRGKQEDTLLRFQSGVALVERELSGVDPDREGAEGEFNNALARITDASVESDTAPPTAGEFRAVLTTGGDESGQTSAGPIEDVPRDLREDVVGGALAFQYWTVREGDAAVPTLILGQPVRTAGARVVEFYMLFPLDAEQRTLGLVQSTLIVGGLLLLLLLAAIASLVTRQVVRPVREAAEIAERFADGHLDERMPVRGDDELARLGESYNEMASSIQVQIRQLEEFGALQRRFTSDVSHELRTPLTTVRMAADVLYASREQLLPALHRSSELLVTELDRFEALLGDLLEISRLDAGVADLVTDRVDLRTVVLRAVDSVRGIADDTGTELVLDLPEGLHAEVDPRRVERIVRNLVANAVDHGEGRPVHVRVAADDDTVAVLVRDHGVGLRPGEAGLVFNRFWRAEESRARRSGGSGLGLSISIEDARLHGGWLQAWGAPGQGSAFRLTLPRETGGTVRASPLPLGPEPGAVPTGSAPVPVRPRPAAEPVAEQAVGWTGGWSVDDDEDGDRHSDDGDRDGDGERNDGDGGLGAGESREVAR